MGAVDGKVHGAADGRLRAADGKVRRANGRLRAADGRAPNRSLIVH